MDLGLKGKVAVVTASSRGIGRAVAECFAAEGCSLALCARNEERLTSAAKAIQNKHGVEVFAESVDISDGTEVTRFIENVGEKFGRIDILVNNAGGPKSGTFEALADKDWRHAFELNLMSVVRCIRGVLPYMKEQNWGRIINMTSISVKQPIENLLLSNSIRAAVVGLTKTLADELAPYNITVNSVAPGYTHTERLDELSLSLSKKKGVRQEQIFEDWEAKIPLKRLALPKEIADAVLFLSSERAAYITGVTLHVDGGYIRGIM